MVIRRVQVLVMVLLSVAALSCGSGSQQNEPRVDQTAEWVYAGEAAMADFKKALDRQALAPTGVVWNDAAVRKGPGEGEWAWYARGNVDDQAAMEVVEGGQAQIALDAAWIKIAAPLNSAQGPFPDWWHNSVEDTVYYAVDGYVNYIVVASDGSFVQMMIWITPG